MWGCFEACLCSRETDCNWRPKKTTSGEYRLTFAIEEEVYVLTVWRYAYRGH